MTTLFCYPFDYGDGIVPVSFNPEIHIFDDGEWPDHPNTHKAPPWDTDALEIAGGIIEVAKRINADLIVPISEDAVLPCGAATTALNLNRGINFEIAKRCVDRKLQREALPEDLNPKWVVNKDLDYPFVRKEPKSSANSGVTIIWDHDFVTEAVVNQQRKPNLLDSAIGGYSYISEEYIDARQYEVSGCIYKNGTVELNNILLQRWLLPRLAIISDYVVLSKEPDGIVDTVIRAIKSLGLNNCLFCVELRGPPWKIIEVNGRSGEEPQIYKRYATKLNTHDHPLNVASRLLG